jgi:hypothetical protein
MKLQALLVVAQRQGEPAHRRSRIGVKQRDGGRHPDQCEVVHLDRLAVGDAAPWHAHRRDPGLAAEQAFPVRRQRMQHLGQRQRDEGEIDA